MINFEKIVPGKIIYLKSILEQMPRIIGNLCRTPSMKTYGCFDRHYWNYSVYDTPGARYQEGVLILALLYKVDNPQNPYYQYAPMLEWIKAGLNFWSRTQLRSGAFNDLYPNENSYVATAFSLYAVTETVLVLQEELRVTKNVDQSIYKAAEWLLRNPNSVVINQECGAVIALHNAGIILKNDTYQKVALSIVEDISMKQNDEGWLDEYGGADIGYLSVAVDYLAKYWKKTENKTAKRVALNAIKFLSHFCHPDYTFGGEYGSRNTSYFLPHGIEVFAAIDQTATEIAANVRIAIDRKSSVGPHVLDNKYLIFNGYSYLQAYLDGIEKIESLSKQSNEVFKYFSKSGLVIQNQDAFHLVSNLRKGGAMRLLFKKNDKFLCDSGILIKGKDNKMLSSCWLNPETKILATQLTLNSEGFLSYPFDNRLTIMRNLILRMVQLTVGRYEKGANWFKKQLRRKIIGKQNISNVRFKRTVKIDKEQVEIDDTLYDLNGVFEIVVGGEIDSIYGESARYISREANILNTIIISDVKVNGGKFTVKRRYDVTGKCRTRCSQS